MDTIDTLLSIERELTHWFFTATPTDEMTRQQMQKVLAIRDRLHQKINEIVLERAQLAALDLAGPTAALDNLNNRLKATTKSIASAQEVIAIGAEVVSIALGILTLVL